MPRLAAAWSSPEQPGAEGGLRKASWPRSEPPRLPRRSSRSERTLTGSAPPCQSDPGSFCLLAHLSVMSRLGPCQAPVSLGQSSAALAAPAVSGPFTDLGAQWPSVRSGSFTWVACSTLSTCLSSRASFPTPPPSRASPSRAPTLTMAMTAALTLRRPSARLPQLALTRPNTHLTPPA